MKTTPVERDALFKGFASALFKRDMDALYKVVSPGFIWRYHDGVSSEVILTRPASNTSTRTRRFIRRSVSMTSFIITLLMSPS
jgi:hypothetical protein